MTGAAPYSDGLSLAELTNDCNLHRHKTHSETYRRFLQTDTNSTSW